MSGCSVGSSAVCGHRKTVLVVASSYNLRLVSVGDLRLVSVGNLRLVRVGGQCAWFHDSAALGSSDHLWLNCSDSVDSGWCEILVGNIPSLSN